MKVDGPGNVRGQAPVRRTGKADGASGSSFAKQLKGTDDAAPAAAVGGAAGVGAVAGVFAAQEVDDAAARASRGKKRAQDMLDKLDDIRHGLLSGELSADKLMDLNKLIQSRKVAVDDPALAQLLDEIDLRAQVELAKFQRR